MRRRSPPLVVRLAVGAAILGPLVGGCAGAATALPATAPLAGGLPVRRHPVALATGRLYTTPDGGFYQDPAVMDVYYARRVRLPPVLALLPPADRRAARDLAGDGPLLEVVARATNRGASTGSVSLANTVLESQRTSQLVPRRVRGAVTHTFYEPIRPILVLASRPLDLCAASIAPGGSVWLLAVFPPVDPRVRVALVAQGLYGFYLPVASGGVPPGLPLRLYTGDVNRCVQASVG